MKPVTKNIFLFAGEPSGDLHGSHLLAALKPLLPHSSFRGVGGPLMRSQGLECLLQMEDFMVMGFTDVLMNFPRLYRQFYHVRDDILLHLPDAIIFIDYPGFNLRMAKALRQKGYKGKLIHYISPSVWAWGKNRIEKMRQTLDLLLTIYPFEVACFAHTDLAVKYVGNPLQEAIQKYTYHTDFPFPPHLIALFPGSRLGEIQRNLPKMMEAALAMKRQYPEVNIALSYSEENFLPVIQESIEKYALQVCMVPKSHTYELMKQCEVAIAKSGTVTLELALHCCPTVVVYELTLLNRLLATYLFRIHLPHYCIVNILANKRVFPELIAEGFTGENLLAHLISLYQKGETRQHVLQECQNIHVLLQNHLGSQNAATAIKDIL